MRIRKFPTLMVIFVSESVVLRSSSKNDVQRKRGAMRLEGVILYSVCIRLRKRAHKCPAAPEVTLLSFH